MDLADPVPAPLPGLLRYAGRTDVVVLARPRGGVPVAFEVAQALGAPVDGFLVRKLGVPGHEEVALGAIASGGIRVLNDDLVRRLGTSKEALEAVTARAEAELRRRETAYRGSRPRVPIAGRTALRREGPARIVVAVPIASAEACDEFRRDVEDVVCAVTPEPFRAVGAWYEDFTQTSDAEVRHLPGRSGPGPSPAGLTAPPDGA